MRVPASSRPQAVLVLLLLSCAGAIPSEPTPAEVAEVAEAAEVDDGPPALMGVVSAHEALHHAEEYEVAFADYSPEPGAVELLATSETEIEIEIVFGTWCVDSTREVPHFFRILQAAAEVRESLGLGPLPIRMEFLAVDRTKLEPVDLLTGKGIERVPTFIVRRDSREIGRIVETPMGLLEEDLVLLVLEAGVAGE